jgi:hypothetical protein
MNDPLKEVITKLKFKLALAEFLLEQGNMIGVQDRNAVLREIIQDINDEDQKQLKIKD